MKLVADGGLGLKCWLRGLLIQIEPRPAMKGNPNTVCGPGERAIVPTISSLYLIFVDYIVPLLVCLTGPKYFRKTIFGGIRKESLKEGLLLFPY